MLTRIASEKVHEQVARAVRYCGDTAGSVVCGVLCPRGLASILPRTFQASQQGESRKRSYALLSFALRLLHVVLGHAAYDLGYQCTIRLGYVSRRLVFQQRLCSRRDELIINDENWLVFVCTNTQG